MRHRQSFDQSWPSLIKRSPQFGWTGLCRTGAGHDDQINTQQQGLVMTERFPHDTFETIALYRELEMFFGCDQADAAWGRGNHPVCQ